MIVFWRVIFLMNVFGWEIGSLPNLCLMACQYIISITQKQGATARNGFQILILHPKIQLFKKKKLAFWGDGHFGKFYRKSNKFRIEQMP